MARTSVRRLAAGAVLGAAALSSVTGTAAAATARPAEGAPAVRAAADPRPECRGGRWRDCWEYYSWYWTYASCHDKGREQVRLARYDDYECSGGHGLVVWLWLHRP